MAGFWANAQEMNGKALTMADIPNSWGAVRVRWKQSEDKTHWYSTEGDILSNDEMEARNKRLEGTWVKITDNDGNDVTKAVLESLPEA